MTDTDLPTRRPSTFPETVDRPAATVRGVLLAAGTSSRYGDANKLLQPLDGTPVVRHAAETLVESTLDGVTVVIGHEADRVQAAVSDLPVLVCRNDEFGAGQSTSVRAGVVDVVDRGANAVCIALGDMPWVSTGTVNALVDAYRRGVSPLLVTTHEGERGNPVLFDGAYFDRLIDVDGDTGGRRLVVESDETVAIETDDTGVLRDVNRPTDMPDE